MDHREIATYLIENRRATRTRRGRPCPVCEHLDGHCLRLDDGSAALCPKSDGSGSVWKKRCGEYGWLYVLSGFSEAKPLPPMKAQPELTDLELHARWAPRAKAWWRDSGGYTTTKLADILGVATWALNELLVGWDGRAWTFPERSGDGWIVGINRRFEDGMKRCAVGSRRGLTYSDAWVDCPGPVLLVEGGSDVAAGITMGLATVGRPSNRGGVVYIGQLLKGSNRRVIVVGERDKKADGQWPGMEGGKDTAIKLAKSLRCLVSCRLLPGGAKDLRAWWRAQGVGVEEGFDAGKKLLKLWGVR